MANLFFFINYDFIFRRIITPTFTADIVFVKSKASEIKPAIAHTQSIEDLASSCSWNVHGQSSPTYTQKRRPNCAANALSEGSKYVGL